MSPTPYTDNIVNRLIESTLNSQTLEFNLRQGIREAIEKSVRPISRQILSEELEENGLDINMEFDISDNFDPKTSFKRIFDKVVEISVDQIESHLEARMTNHLSTSITSIAESNNPYHKYFSNGYTTLCG